MYYMIATFKPRFDDAILHAIKGEVIVIFNRKEGRGVVDFTTFQIQLIDALDPEITLVRLLNARELQGFACA